MAGFTPTRIPARGDDDLGGTYRPESGFDVSCLPSPCHRTVRKDGVAGPRKSDRMGDRVKSGPEPMIAAACGDLAPMPFTHIHELLNGDAISSGRIAGDLDPLPGRSRADAT